MLNKPQQIKKIRNYIKHFSNHNSMKLEVNYRINRKRTHTCRVNNMILKRKQWVNEEIKEEIRKYLEINENNNIVFQKLWDAMKTVLRGKYATIQAFLKKKENLK